MTCDWRTWMSVSLADGVQAYTVLERIDFVFIPVKRKHTVPSGEVHSSIKTSIICCNHQIVDSIQQPTTNALCTDNCKILSIVPSQVPRTEPRGKYVPRTGVSNCPESRRLKQRSPSNALYSVNDMFQRKTHQSCTTKECTTRHVLATST